ncbi:MAG: NAD(P)-dependent oxidoreductase [Acidimicrobiia bacterium]|jgi:D-3-phosphoglycerate dehydrogenase
MRILVADRLPEPQLDKLVSRGHDVRYEPGLSASDLPGVIADTEALVVRSTQVTAGTIEAGEQLGLIVRAGAGTNTIDMKTASAQGVYVSNVPGKNSVAVAELTMGLILALDRHIPDNVAGLRDENWQKSRFSKARGLKGRRLGLIGLGSIGWEVAVRAKAFGMKVLSLERPDRPEDLSEAIAELGMRLYPDLESLLPECDYVSLHVPSTPETSGLVDARFLSLMSDGACLVNTSRADVIVAQDLLEALDEKDLRAALDVFPDEPETGEAPFVSELAKHPNVYGTHHIGASTEQAQESVAKQVVKIIDDYCDGGVKNVVNLAEPMSHTTVIGIRHVDQVGVLSQVFSVLRVGHINVEHMENHVFEGAKAAKAVIHLHGDFNSALRKEIEDLEGVIHVEVLRESG